MENDKNLSTNEKIRWLYIRKFMRKQVSQQQLKSCQGNIWKLKYWHH